MPAPAGSSVACTLGGGVVPLGAGTVFSTGAEGAGVVGVAGASVVAAGVAGAAGMSAGFFCMAHQPRRKAATSAAMTHGSQPMPPRAAATGAAATAVADTIHSRRSPM